MLNTYFLFHSQSVLLPKPPKPLLGPNAQSGLIGGPLFGTRLEVVLMGRKCAHLALINPRPERNKEKAAIHARQGPEALRRYEYRIKEEQNN